MLMRSRTWFVQSLNSARDGWHCQHGRIERRPIFGRILRLPSEPKAPMKKLQAAVLHHLIPGEEWHEALSHDGPHGRIMRASASERKGSSLSVLRSQFHFTKESDTCRTR